MLRGAFIVAVGVSLAAACGIGGCVLLHIEPYPKEMIVAMIVAAGCGMLSAAVAVMGAAASRQVSAQVGLMATVVHLLGCLLMTGGAMMSGLVKPVPMLLWMLPMYWATLIGLVLTILWLINAGPRQPSGDPVN